MAIYFVKKWRPPTSTQDSDELEDEVNSLKDGQSVDALKILKKAEKKKNSHRLKNMIKKGSVPGEVVEKVDMDRINEDSEDFLFIDKRKPVGIINQLKKPVSDLSKGLV